jgi:hypothetical protein
MNPQENIAMKFIALWTHKPNSDTGKITEAIKRRAEFDMPEGVKLVAEYWTTRTSPAAVSVFEADDAAKIMQMSIYWADYLMVDVFPVEEWQTALKNLRGKKGR